MEGGGWVRGLLFEVFFASGDDDGFTDLDDLLCFRKFDNPNRFWVDFEDFRDGRT